MFPNRATANAQTVFAALCIGLMGAGCPAAPTTTLGPAVTAPAPLPSLAVERQAGLPRFSAVIRDGDPQPALVLAIAGHDDQGSAAGAADASAADASVSLLANAVLAAVLSSRVAARMDANADFSVHHDGAGIRLQLRLPATTEAAAEASRQFFEATIHAANQPIVEPTAWRQQAESNVAHAGLPALAAAAQQPIAHCRGLAQASAKDVAAWRALDWSQADRLRDLDQWRRQRLGAERMAVGIVGPSDAVAAVRAAWRASKGWPAGLPTGDAWPATQSGGYLSASVADGAAELEIAMRLPSANLAMAVSENAAARLSGKLQLLSPAWRLEHIHAAALPTGGCWYARLRHDADAPLEDNAAAASQAARLVERDVVQQLELRQRAELHGEPDLYVGDAMASAVRSAWWSLSEPAQQPVRSLTLLAASAMGERPAANDDAAVAQAFATALANEAGVQPLRDDARVLIEQGQSQLWILAANPCALSDSNRAEGALSGLALFGSGGNADAGDSVVFEPWLGADGIGVLAHAPARPQESAAALALRLADRLGARLTRLPKGQADLARAWLQLDAVTAGTSADLASRLAREVAPAAPQQLIPWADAPAAGTSAADVHARWVDLLAGPWRIAVLANQSEAQGLLALEALEGWLPRDRPRACSAPTAYSAAASAAPTAAEAPTQRAMLGLRLDDATPLRAAVMRELIGGALAAHASSVPEGMRIGELQLLGPRGQPRLLAVEIAVTTDPAVVMTGLKEDLAKLAGSLDDRTIEAATERAEAAWVRRRRDPRERLLQRWLGFPAALTTADPGLRPWLRSQLKAGLIEVFAAPE